MTALFDPKLARACDTFTVFEDFFTATPQGWTAANAALGTGTGGELVLSNAAVTAHLGEFAHSEEWFNFVNEKPISVIGRLKLTEGATDDMNVGIGLMADVALASMGNDGAGPVASKHGAMIYKVDGGTVWNFWSNSSGAGAGTRTASNATRTATYTTFAITIVSVNSVEIELVPWIDLAGGRDLKQMQDANGNLIKHRMTIANAATMALCCVVKNGAGGAAAEIVTLDYLGATQKR